MRLCVLLIPIVVQALPTNESNTSSDNLCKDIECSFGHYCTSEGYCKISDVTIISIVVSCIVLVVLLPLSTCVLLYCAGIACNIRCINNFFERIRIRFRRRNHSSSRRQDDRPPANLNSRRKRDVRKYLRDNDKKRNKKHGKKNRSEKPYPVRGSVFVRSAPPKSDPTDEQYSDEQDTQPQKTQQDRTTGNESTEPDAQNSPFPVKQPRQYTPAYAPKVRTAQSPMKRTDDENTQDLFGA